MINSSYYSPAPALALVVQSDCVKKTSWGSCIDLFSADLKLQPFSFQHCPWKSLFWEKRDALIATSGVWSGSEASDSLSGAKSAAGQTWFSFRQGNEREAQRGHLNVLYFCIYLETTNKKEPYVFLIWGLTREMVGNKEGVRKVKLFPLIFSTGVSPVQHERQNTRGIK